VRGKKGREGQEGKEEGPVVTLQVEAFDYHNNVIVTRPMILCEWQRAVGHGHN